MGFLTSEVGYTTAMPRREDHEVHKDMWWHWIKNIFCWTYTDHYRLQRNHTVGSIQRLMSEKEGIADIRLENIRVGTVSVRWDE
jgi:hypothetical protein